MRRQKRLSFLNSKPTNLLPNVAVVSFLPNKRPIMKPNNSKACRNKRIAQGHTVIHNRTDVKLM